MFHITSPGRINLIGEHTDYTNGYVMPMAINLHTTLEAKPADVVEVYSEAFDEVKQFKLTDLSRENSWIDYVKGIYAVLFEEGYLPGGMKAQAGGDLPLNAGLSSSASFELAIIAFLNTAYDLDLSREGMALLSQKAENEFVDVPCGIMDQFTIGLSQAHHALFLDTETLEYEYVPFPEILQIIVFHTGVERRLKDSAYAQRRKTAKKALQTLGTLSSKRISKEALKELPPLQRKRCGYILRENQRVCEAKDSLRSQNIEKFGQILVEAHRDVSKNYEVSCQELDFLVDRFLEMGAYGARLTGAGFGGVAIAIAEKHQAQEIAKNVFSSYTTEFPEKDPYYALVKPAQGVQVSLNSNL